MIQSDKLMLLAKRIANIPEKLELDLAETAVDDVRKIIRARAKNPTGRYERAVTSVRTSNSVKVHDGGIVYGPWLEGVSSRNSSSSFGGYHQFELSRRSVRKKAKVQAQVAVRRALRGSL